MLAVLNGRDALVALPTGFGKSLIYQVPTMVLDRPTIVISPLIALMADQEQALRRCGVPVIALHSRLRAAERRAALERLRKGGRLVVLTTPETLESAATAPLFERLRPALLCIDEAHCISEWARLPVLLPPPRRRSQTSGQSAGACPHGNSNPTRPGGHRRTASPGQTPGDRRTGSPREPSPDRRHCAWFREVPRRRPAHQASATPGHHLLRHDHRGR
jgi:DEAD/DEAH box helicase